MKRQLAAIGLASILTVPTWITAAYPLEANAKKVTVSKKAKAVISSIKKLNSKKANYIKKTLLVKAAYNKLSKKDKKAIKNYKVLAKHIKMTNSMIAKVEKIKKEASLVTTKNYKNRGARLQKMYANLDKASKDYIPVSTVKKVIYYSDLVDANNQVKKLAALAAQPTATLTSVTDVINVRNSPAIMEFITAYEKLTDVQKQIIGGSQEAIDYLIALKPLVRDAIKIDGQYDKLDPKGTAYLKAAYDLFNNYKANKDNVVTISYEENETPKKVDYRLSQFTKNDTNINGIDSKIAQELAVKKAFEDAVNALPGTTDRLKLVNGAVDAFKAANRTTFGGKKLKGKAIDLVDKATIAEYKKYENIPSVVTTMQALPDYNSKNAEAETNRSKLTGAGLTSGEVDTLVNQGKLKREKDVDALDAAIKSYVKLGGDQKDIVDSEISTKKDYVNDVAAIKKGQALNKKYNDALKKNDLASALLQFKDYKTAAKNDDRAVRYIVDGMDIGVIPTTYSAQIANVQKFEDAVSSYKDISSIKTADDLFKTISKDKLSGVTMVDKNALKDYTLAKNVLDIDELMKKSLMNQVGYTTKKLLAIQSVTKLYNKLDAPKKKIVEAVYPGVVDFAADEKEIKTAMAVDKKFLELKPSKKSYIKDAKTVYNLYLDSNYVARKYVTNSSKIEALSELLKSPQSIVDAFEKSVNNVYEEVYVTTPLNGTTIANIKNVINTYENSIKPYPKNNDLLDSDVLKKYKKLTPIVDVYNQIFILKPTPKTDIERDNIINAMKSYNKLDKFGKYVIGIETRLVTNLPLLGDEEQINEAKKIDAAYKALKVDDKQYESKLYNIYKSYTKAASDVRNYVINKKVLEEARAKYADAIKQATNFEDAVAKINRNSKIIDVHNLKKIYDDMKRKTPEALLFIDPDLNKKYNQYTDLLFIQDVAQTVFDQQRINGKWVKYDHWFYSYSQTQDHRNDVLNMRKALLMFQKFNAIQISIINNSPNYTSYTGMKEDEKGNDIPIYDSNGKVIGYKSETEFTTKFEPDEVIYNPGEWLNYTQIQNLLDAIAIEDSYKALKPGSKSYAKDAMKLIAQYNAKGIPVKMYTLIRPELEELERKYDVPVQNVLSFETEVKKYDPNTGTISGLTPMRNAYLKLDSVALSIVDPDILKKYNNYQSAIDGNGLFKALSLGAKTMPNIAKTLEFIAAYNKLAPDAKKIVRTENASRLTAIDTLLADEKQIKDAQTVDKKYEAIDPKSPTYESQVLKVYADFAKLPDETKSTYSVYAQKLIDFNTAYGTGGQYVAPNENPKKTAEEFERLVTALNSESPYDDVSKTNILYEFLKDKNDYTSPNKPSIGLNFVDKKIITKYNQYAGIVDIKKQLDTVSYPKGTQFTLAEKTAIGEAIKVYNKLTSNPKNIVEKDIVFGNVTGDATQTKRYLLHAESDIKKAEAVDGMFDKIKKGDKTFAKNMIIAMKGYNGLTPFQKQFFMRTTDYNMYKEYDKAPISGPVDTIPEAVTAVFNFEEKVRNANTMQEKITQSEPNGKISPDDYKTMLNLIIDMDKYYKFINNDFTINKESIRLLSLADGEMVSRYKYYMAAYKVQEYLDKLAGK